MNAVVALIPVLLQLMESGIALAPEITSELQSIFASIGGNAAAITPTQEAAIWDAVTAINAQISAAN